MWGLGQTSTFFQLFWFSIFLTGMYDSEMWCRGRMGHKEHCCIGPISFWWFLTPFYTTCLLKFWFFRNCLSWRLKTCATGFSMPWTLNMLHSSHFDAFSQSKSTKCEIFAWNFDFSGTAYHRDSKPVQLDSACLEP